ncbi:hypothetical protein TSOC_008975 [Tetrabaena socialis]|uniref:Uncharacterized protein n=1 Tax=Tetrabaena socialis TaxID=47790 RepID=A0A2J7ZXD0_9CHLO|nr:hypothetical protein TSOC_008975 [Tetrabaena socialis]|eukprot:PNH04917.1 hypothetical protein TSOC_008975 [Tetrabaena socialis]
MEPATSKLFCAARAVWHRCRGRRAPGTEGRSSNKPASLSGLRAYFLSSTMLSAELLAEEEGPPASALPTLRRLLSAVRVWTSVSGAMLE